jgi:hypothetical protein
VGSWSGLFPYSYGGSHGLSPCSLFGISAPQLREEIRGLKGGVKMLVEKKFILDNE